MKRFFVLFSALLVGCQTAAPAPDAGLDAAKTAQKPEAVKKEVRTEGYLVVAPDRGFMGNEEIRETFSAFSGDNNAQLIIVTTAESTRARLASGLKALRDAGAQRVAVLPLFVAASHPSFVLVHQLVDELNANESSRVEFGHSLGESYLGAELLGDRLREVTQPKEKHLVVVGYGALDAASAEQMTQEYRQFAQKAAKGFGFKSVDAAVWPKWTVEDAAFNQAHAAKVDALLKDKNVAVVPFHLGMKLDGMMSAEAAMGGHIPHNAQLVQRELLSDNLVGMHLQREANRFAQLEAKDIGIVVLAHGSDWDWNESMRQTVRPLEDRYMLEYAFSMADRDVIEAAMHRLEARGARGIVVVRIFGLESSFKSTVENLLGLDVEQVRAAAELSANAHAHGGAHAAGGAHDPAHTHAAAGSATDAGHSAAHGHGDTPAADAGHGGHGGHGGGHGHGGHGGGHGMSAGPSPRIRTHTVTTTLGGLEDHNIFARALAARLAAASTDPTNETVVLVAHGMGAEDKNDHWLGLLNSLTEQVKAQSSPDFKAFHFGTWREDWPDKRAEWVPRIRGWVDEGAQNGGRVIVIPARTNAEGPERELLDGLNYELTQGFAPHSLFADWLEAEILEGIDTLTK